MPDLPLADVRVLDLTQILAGPYCTMMLADLGADVVKVERPGGGDGSRQWGPPFVAGESAYFLQVNRNKRSIAVDLKHPDGVRVAQRLATAADVVIENFLPRAGERYGLDAASLRAADPAIVHCSIRGYPTGHPEAAKPGYDFVMQGIGGIMSMQGEPDGEPIKVAVAISDIVAGQFASSAILAALLRRARTGVGAELEVSLLDAQVAWLANRGGDWLIGEIEPVRLGNAHPSIVPYETFRAEDGYVNLAVGNDEQFARFCREAGLDERRRRPGLPHEPAAGGASRAARARAGEDDRRPPGVALARGARPRRGARRPGALGAGRAGRARRPHRRDRRPSHRRPAAHDRLAHADRRRAPARPPAAAASGRAHGGGAGRGRLLDRRDRRTRDGSVRTRINSRSPADVAELVDAHGSGPCGRKVVEVQVLSSA